MILIELLAKLAALPALAAARFTEELMHICDEWKFPRGLCIITVGLCVMVFFTAAFLGLLTLIAPPR